MNMREVQSYYDSHVNSTILELRNGSTLFGEKFNIVGDGKPTTAPSMPLTLALLGSSLPHNVLTRWSCHNFDTSVCFDGCNDISETLERLQQFRTNAGRLPGQGLALLLLIVSLCVLRALHVMYRYVNFSVALKFLLSLSCRFPNK